MISRIFKSVYKLKDILFTNYPYVILLIYGLVIFGSMIKINIFRYENFDMGKFDLGNMTQMAWYTLRGKLMYLTDYFGSNVPRWSMSHVDPILLLFVPLFYLIPHPLTLVFAQNFLIIFASFFIYKISLIKTKSTNFSLFLSLGYLSYPALGFLLAWTGYHGVTPAIFFFLWFFYLLTKYQEENRTLKLKEYFYLTILAFITMTGKEQIALYFIMVGIYLFLATTYKKYAVFLTIFSIVWFVFVFFIVIPHYSSYRVASFERFTELTGISKEDVPNIYNENYFLSRYSEFGNSYQEIIITMFLNPVKTASIFVSGDKIDNLNLTFGPLIYLPFLSPLILVISFPDFLINYSTTQGGIGTSEIYNHRISMIIPVLFLAVIYGLSYFHYFLSLFKNKSNKIYSYLLKYYFTFFGVVLFSTCLYFSLYVGQKNPILSWIFESFQKRINVFAKSDESLIGKTFQVGEILRFSPLEKNDRECIRRIISEIPPKVSVSGPDFMGSHLAQRETYSIFPAGKSSSDYLIVDIFSQKLLRILELDLDLNRNFIAEVLNNKNYDLQFSCSNLMVFKKVSDDKVIDPTIELPFQEYRSYDTKFSFPIHSGLILADVDYSKDLKLGEKSKLRYVFTKDGSRNLSGFVLYTSLINKENGEIFQFANYPSYSFSNLDSWESGRFYEEIIEFYVPPYLESGYYYLFVGMDNQINTRNLYLGEVSIR
jgi:uncharacterized membrane protein